MGPLGASAGKVGLNRHQSSKKKEGEDEVRIAMAEEVLCITRLPHLYPTCEGEKLFPNCYADRLGKTMTRST